MDKINVVFLIGLPGSGKTTLLTKHNGIDLDRFGSWRKTADGNKWSTDIEKLYDAVFVRNEGVMEGRVLLGGVSDNILDVLISIASFKMVASLTLVWLEPSLSRLSQTYTARAEAGHGKGWVDWTTFFIDGAPTDAFISMRERVATSFVTALSKLKELGHVPEFSILYE